MAGFYSILTKRIDALDPDTPEARRRLYERATAALIAEMRGPDPALGQSEFQAAWRSLKEAIVRIEREIEAEPEVTAETEIEPETDTETEAEPGADTMSETEREARLEAQRHRPSPRPTATPSTTLPRSGIAATSTQSPMRLGGQRRAGLMEVLTRAFRRHPGGPARRRPVDRGEEPSDFWSELASAQARDNWLSDLLTRASREDHEMRKKRT
jgi:hypothetical protein